MAIEQLQENPLAFWEINLLSPVQEIYLIYFPSIKQKEIAKKGEIWLHKYLLISMSKDVKMNVKKGNKLKERTKKIDYIDI